jgi:hypothetical protein
VDHLLLAARVLIATVFAVSLGTKLRGRAAFATFVASVRGLAPRVPARATATAVALGEVGMLVLLGYPPTARLGFAVALGLLGAFTVALVGAVRRERKVDCGCFGTSATPVGLPHIIRNITLMICAAAGIAAGTTGVPALPGALTSAAVGAVVAGMLVLGDDVVELFRPKT